MKIEKLMLSISPICNLLVAVGHLYFQLLWKVSKLFGFVFYTWRKKILQFAMQLEVTTKSYEGLIACLPQHMN